jgi:hypothetical protein
MDPIDALTERDPYPDVETQTCRVYLIAQAPAASAP